MTVIGDGTKKDTQSVTLTNTPDVTDFTQNPDGSYTKTENGVETVIKPSLDEKGNWLGYEQTVTTTAASSSTATEEGAPTTETTGPVTELTPLPESSATTETVTIDLPERPAAGTSLTEDGVKVETVVTDILAEDGVTVIGYRTETLTTNPDGTSSAKSEELYGVKRTTTTVTITKSEGTATTIDKTTTPVTETTTDTTETTTETTTVTGGDRTLELTVGEIEEDNGHGTVHEGFIQPDLSMKPGFGVGKNDDDLVNGFYPGTENAVENGYAYYYTGNRGLESAYYFRYQLNGEEKRNIATQFELQDAKGNKIYVYCSDLNHEPQKGAVYDQSAVEHAEFLSEDDEAHLRAIVTHGYWGAEQGAGSMETFKRYLIENSNGTLTEADLKDLTPGQALLATEAAIWKYGNSENIEIDANYLTGWVVSGGRDPQNPAGFIKTKLDGSEPVQEMLAKVYNVLIGLTEKAPDHTPLTEENVHVQTTVSVAENSNVGSLSLNVTTDAQDAMGSYVLMVTDEQGKEISKQEFLNVLISSLSLQNLDLGQIAGARSLNVSITGKQDMGQNAYLFKAKEGYKESQTFIGVIASIRDICLRFTLDLNLTDPNARAEGRTETKTSEETTVKTWDKVETKKTTSKVTNLVTKTEKTNEAEQYRVWELSYNNSKDDGGEEEETKQTEATEETTEATRETEGRYEGGEADTGIAKTGDTIGAWFLINALSALALFCLYMYKRSRGAKA